MGNKTMIQTAKAPGIDAGHAKGSVSLKKSTDCGFDFDSLVHAAEQGDTDAQFILAELYYNRYDEGDGLKEDLAEAVRWYQEAAGHGDARAQFEIGWCYQSGSGIEEDPEKAVQWYRIAAEQGYARAQYWLAWCYRYGRGIGKDPEEAARWYRTAAEQGNEEALEDLAELGCAVW